MGLETGTYVNDLNTANPTSTDPKSQGDDHLRLIKTVLKNTFAGFPGLVVATGTEAQGATVNDYTVTLSPSPAAYTSFFFIGFKATHNNNGAATLQVGSLGTKALVAVDGQALVNGDIKNGMTVVAWYDGTQFYLISANDRAHRGGDVYLGTHDFTGATPKVPTKTQGDNSTNAASTAYVDLSTANEAAIRLANDNAEIAARQAAVALKADIVSPAFTGVPTAPTPATGTSTSQLATCAFVVATAFNAALPGQAGNAGKVVTTDGTNASWSSLKTINNQTLLGSGNIFLPGSDGTTATGSVTLIASSPAVQVITTTGPGQSVTLPDATTCNKAVPLFSISNAGEYDLLIKDASGATKGFVRPFRNIVVGLASNATSAGVWALNGAQLIGITARRDFTAALSNSGSAVTTVTIDSNRTMIVFGGTTVYAIVYDKSTQTWGNVTTVATGCTSGQFNAILSAANQVLVVAGKTSVSALLAVTLTVSGTSITVNTPANGNTGGINTLGDLVQVGSAFVVSAKDDTNSQTRLHAITISGTTCTIGAAANTTTYYSLGVPTLMTVSSTVVLSVGSNGSFVKAQAFSLSGTTLTPGTENSGGPGVTTTNFHKIAALPNGRFAIGYVQQSASFWCRLYSLSGTTITATEVQVEAINLSQVSWDWAVVGTNKLAIMWLNGSNTISTNVLTDTSGTISQGTSVVVPHGSTSTSDIFAALSVSGNLAKFITASITGADGGAITVFTIDATGSSPVITIQSRAKRASGASGVTLAFPGRTGTKTTRNPATLTNGTLFAGIAQGLQQLSASLLVGNEINIMDAPPSIIGTPTAVGGTSRESWATLNNGVSLQLVEMAA